MRLELTRYCYHKILSLARLPIPTLPHVSWRKLPLSPDDLPIIANPF